MTDPVEAQRLKPGEYRLATSHVDTGMRFRYRDDLYEITGQPLSLFAGPLHRGVRMSEIPPHEYVAVRNSMGLLDPDSLEERLCRAEHHAGLLEIGLPGRQSHCWLCRRSYEESE